MSWCGSTSSRTRCAAHRPSRAIAVPQSAARTAIAAHQEDNEFRFRKGGNGGARRAAGASAQPPAAATAQPQPASSSRRRRRPSAAQAYPPAAPQGAPQPTIRNAAVADHAQLRPADAAAMCSTRTRIRMRRARRVALGQLPAGQPSAPQSPDRCSRRSGRRARRPRCRRAARSVQARRRAAARSQAAAGAAAARAMLDRRGRRARRRSPKDQFDLGYGYIQRKDYALAEETLRDFVQRYPNDRMTRGRALLARRKPVPAPALPGRGGSLSRRDDEIRNRRQGAGRAAAARPIACRPGAEGNGLRVVRRSRAANIRAPRSSVKQGVEREQKRVRC